ncbi:MULTISPECIES: response regulator [Pseudomonas]|uniref:response regulator n=1 Tax=Pseudomonas TaxID=286 RepID=UPI00070F2E16|nr:MULTISPECIES: response regulator [Pseudomonas]KQW19990.1 two-component system response regulator [Pseudomonas sp. Root401]PWD02110.1 response regulator [Pseudomonas amygdali pv. lachrymans]WHS57588.1 response regulator [Pseudomonas brassicacearum]WNZ87332.1 response regulator [Pseudomonas sp. P108]
MSEKQYRVMVIDDSKTIRTTAEAFVRELGHEVMCGTDGLNGISHMLTFQPDILFIDLEMPRMNGIEMAKLVRANSMFKDTPIVMLSSKDGMFDVALATEAGASSYIVKPPRKDSIAAAIAKHLG